jgi:hypothetical protein
MSGPVSDRDGVALARIVLLLSLVSRRTLFSPFRGAWALPVVKAGWCAFVCCKLQYCRA